MKPPRYLAACAILIGCCAYPVEAVTLETVLRTTVEKNPAILEAKAGLEQAAGQRLVFRSVALPHAELGVPAGVQAGHRSGESGVKGFAVTWRFGTNVIQCWLAGFSAARRCRAPDCATTIERGCRGTIARGSAGLLLCSFQPVARIYSQRTTTKAGREYSYAEKPL